MSAKDNMQECHDEIFEHAPNCRGHVIFTSFNSQICIDACTCVVALMVDMYSHFYLPSRFVPLMRGKLTVKFEPKT